MDDADPRRKSWWGRNWKWVVPLGCLSPIIVVGGCTAGLYFLFSGWVKSSEFYTESLAAVARDPQVIAAIGEPITAGRITTCSMTMSDSDGSATITYNISGPKGDATVNVHASQKADVWTVQKNHVHINSTKEELDVPVTPPVP